MEFNKLIQIINKTSLHVLDHYPQIHVLKGEYEESIDSKLKSRLVEIENLWTSYFL